MYLYFLKLVTNKLVHQPLPLVLVIRQTTSALSKSTSIPGVARGNDIYRIL